MAMKSQQNNRLTYLKDVVTLELIEEKCIGCGQCEIVCPHRVFQVAEKKARIIERDSCIECGACSKNCPVDAINVEAGVGCASAIIYSWLTGNEPSCDCDDGSSSCC